MFLGSGGEYFNLILEGNFSSPCWNDYPHCNLLYPFPGAWNLNHSPVRDFFIGLSRTITTGHNDGDFYIWSCIWNSCWDASKMPSPQVFAAASFLSSIFGALAVVCAYGIGKVLYSRMAGLFFSLILLFNSMWLWNSRGIMQEIYLGFFSLLCLFLLFYSFKNETTKKWTFVLSAVVLGLLFNIKLISIYLLPLILTTILLRVPHNKQFPYLTSLPSRKSILLLMLFVSVSLATTYATEPSYWKDVTYPISDIVKGFRVHYPFFSAPSLDNNNLFTTLATIHSTIIPYFVNYYDQPNKSAPNLSWNAPGTYSSIPVMIFFMVGIVYLCIRFKTKKATYAEFLMTVWVSSIFVLSSLTIVDFQMERYYLLLLFPIMLVSAYGVWRFLERLDKKIHLVLFGSFLISHILTTMVFWKYIYFSTGVRWLNPLGVNLQSALQHKSVIISSIIFVIIFIIILSYKVRINARSRTKDQAQYQQPS
ncbi:MAG: glycosyltransferase family 39 protein [Thaumarchaeota archaeon]|nr:glycosyltransferase family 39 protein [Nitrososphaerota archaeon]